MHAPPTPPTPPRAPWPIALADIPGRGKGVVATREIRPGECVLEERATMTGVSESHRATTCAGCLRRAARCVRTRACERCGEVLLCDDCHRAAELAFGADDARLAMAPNAHTRVKCRGEAVGASAALSTGDRERFRFLVACAELRAMKTMRAETQAREDDRGFDDVASLCPREDDDGGGSWPIASHVDAATRLHPLLFATMHDADIERGVLKVNGASLSSDDFERMYVGTIRENAMLLAKESKNAFGVMAAAAADERDENDFGAARSVRGGALYRDASRVNHGCFPNVARFDNFDDDFQDPSKAFSSPSSLSALCEPSTLRLLAIDVIPAGAEVLMSYLPVNEPVGARRARLRRGFGFACDCARCALEVSWALEDGERTGDEEPTETYDDATTAADASEAAEEARDEATAAALTEEEQTRRADRAPVEYALWFMKNMCAEEDCGGTLAPPNPTATHCACNYCGRIRTDDAFFAQLAGGG